MDLLFRWPCFELCQCFDNRHLKERSLIGLLLIQLKCRRPENKQGAQARGGLRRPLDCSGIPFRLSFALSYIPYYSTLKPFALSN